MACANMRYRVIPTSHYDDQLFHQNKYKVVSFPCGKCSDCTKKRQNDIAVRAGYESMNFTDISFCRLSYRNETLPLSMVPYQVFPDGTKIQDGPATLLSGSFLDDMRVEMAKVPNSIIKGKSRYLHLRPPGMEGFTGEGSYVEYTITPSVKMDDPRLWLKACRVAFKRQYGYALPDFKYLMCAEYGSQYTRPHYHYVFLGLKPWIVDWMLKRWEVQYGFTMRMTVKNTAQDKFRVMSYISKYMAKGDFEAPAVKAGIALKGRYCASRHLGKEFIEGKQAYFLAFDVFGDYNPDTLQLIDQNRPLTLSEQKTLSNMIIQRMSIQVPGFDFRFPLPKSWKYLLFYKKIPRRVGKIEVIHPDDPFEENFSKITVSSSFRYAPYKIYRIVQKTLQDRLLADDLRQLQGFALSLPPGTSVVEANFQFKNFKERLAKSAEAHSKEALRNFYSKDSQ